MKKIAQFLQLALLLYFLLFLVFFFAHDTFGSAFGMDPITPESMMKVFLTGFILFVVTWATTRMHQSSMDADAKKMQAEMNELKAKLYDFEHPKVAPTPKPASPKGQEDSGGIIRPRKNVTDE
ncbi:hypothetical protein J0A68_12520 [Algoriphagus sp. H41]|uniref:DUF1049 domain-containing protein n=1 Tax=Algoriphagus oliviformis TaxID=2811231 RepID=A0ABS3C3S9_9BACT|nr:hypothetical protein [Algoriphagus oliviformis]MBN7811774.1 hypothetical protein [Algoriphagus oliviformis]